MLLHRDLMRGTGFWTSCGNAMATVTLEDGKHPVSPVPRTFLKVPTVDFLDIDNEDYVDALMAETLAQDRRRLRAYLNVRPAGIGLIIAPPGYGKTSVMAMGMLGMVASQTIGKVQCAAGSHEATTNFAQRVYQLDASVTARYNQGKLSDDPSRIRRHLLVRGYKLETEIAGFWRAMRFPQDEPAAKGAWMRESHWKLPCSVAFWLLIVLHHKTVGKDLDIDDCQFLHQLRAKIDGDEGFVRLRALAIGDMDWEEYSKGDSVKDDAIRGLMEEIVLHADGLFTVIYHAILMFDSILLTLSQ